MTVYVDNARRPFGRMLLSHMMSDGTDPLDLELEGMAARIGLRREWKHDDHYDIGVAKREDAISWGAEAVTSRELVRLRRRKRTAP